MPTSIPYDPRLILGNLIHPNDIQQLEKVSDIEAPVNKAQDDLNNSIMAKRKLDMTLQEMIEMNVPQDSLNEFTQEIESVGADIATNAIAYGKAVIAAQKQLKTEGTYNIQLQEVPESPIDWNKSAIKQLDLSSDTMIVDAQYLRNEEEKDGSQAHADSVATTVSATISSIFGPKYSAKAAASAKSSVLNQQSNHSIAGTLVITATCTHKTSDVFAPFVMDPEKAVYAWNALFPSDQIQTTHPETLVAAIENTSTGGKSDNNKFLSLLSGQTIGSSFIGMIHVLQVENTNSSQKSNAAAASFQSEFEWGGFFASGNGSFGVDSDFSNNIKNMLSTSNLTSHCSLVTMGIIPSLKSNNVKTSISQLQPSASEVMGQLAAIQGATDTDVNSVSSEADKAKAGKQFIELNNSYVTSVVSNLTKSDNDNNKMIDVNSLMTAFDDYVQKAEAGNSGVPINFFVRHIDKPMIAKAWLKKFSPQDNWQLSSGDDNSTGEGQTTNSDGTPKS